MWTNLSLVVAFLLLKLAPGESALTITPVNQTLPETNLQFVTSLVCEIVADFTLELSTVASRWAVPDGRTVERGGSLDQYTAIQGSGPRQYETILQVQNLIYTDASIYTCEVRDIRDPPGPWITAQVHLQLKVELTTNFSELVAYDNETQVELKCEMSLYLRPDDHLQWFRGGQLIANGTERYTIIYSDGRSELEGQFGENEVRPSRVSTLTISEPQLADSGTYTCAIRDTDQAENIQLAVQAGISALSPDILSPSTAQPPTVVQSTRPYFTNPSSSPSTSPPRGSETLILPAIIGAVAGVVGIIVVAIIITVVVVVLCIASPWKSKAETKRDTQEEPYYDYVEVKDTTERGHPLSPIDTSINIAYGTARDLETKRGAQEEPYYEEENTTERGHPLSPIDTSVNIAYGTAGDSETKRSAQEEPYYEEENTTERGQPLSPIDTSINIAYGTAHDSGHHTQQLNAGNQPLSFTVNMAYGAVDFSV